jgi:hypothetical protein
MKKAIALALGALMLFACSTLKSGTTSAKNKKFSASMSHTPWYQPDWNRDLMEGYDYMEVVFSDENGINNKLLKYHKTDSLALMNKALKSNGSGLTWQNVLDNGSWTGSGTIGQTVYTITHGLGYTPSSVFIQAQSTAAAEKSFVTNITSTTFQVTFLTIPLLGTNNINLKWYALR